MCVQSGDGGIGRGDGGRPGGGMRGALSGVNWYGSPGCDVVLVSTLPSTASAKVGPFQLSTFPPSSFFSPLLLAFGSCLCSCSGGTADAEIKGTSTLTSIHACITSSL